MAPSHNSRTDAGKAAADVKRAKKSQSGVSKASFIKSNRTKGSTTQVATSERSTLILPEPIEQHLTPTEPIIIDLQEAPISRFSNLIDICSTQSHIAGADVVQVTVVKVPNGKIDDLRIYLLRTVRVADNGKASSLPPNLGPITLWRVWIKQDEELLDQCNHQHFQTPIYSTLFFAMLHLLCTNLC